MRVMLCNVPPEAGPRIAKALVEARLAACVNVLPPVRSVYIWNGQLCEDTELTLIIKVSEQRVQATRERLLELHPYELPEVLVLPVDVDASHTPYVQWVRDNTRAP